MQKLTEWGALYGTKIIGAVAILVLGRIAIGIIMSFVKRMMLKAKVDETLTKFVINVTKIALLTFLVIAALNTLGVQTASFIAIIGAAGLAVGFALKDSLANFASGVMLIIFRPFKGGDFIEAGGSKGIVEEIHIFNTILKTPDNIRVIIPNSNITGGNIVNYSAKGERRINLTIGIGYEDDLKKAKEILHRIINNDDRILKDPAPIIAVKELADSSVNFVVWPWVKAADYWNVMTELTEKIKLTFDENGISIPYPQTDVHLHQIPAQ